jgi:hypothetical protein
MIHRFVLIGLCILVSCVKDDIKTGEMTITPDDTVAIRSFVRTTGSHVNALKLSISGHIAGYGQLSIGDTDSTFYKTYDVRSGDIAIEYDGDWYSEFCYVTYKPNTTTSGRLKLTGDFKGD